MVLVRPPSLNWRSELKLSFVPGVFLWLTLILQTWGLQYTTAMNSTFITTLYVVIVPLLRALKKEERLNWLHWFCVVLALLGTGFVVRIQEITALNWGDLLTLLCAIFAAVHILAIGQKTHETNNAFALNAFQSFWVSLFALFFFPVTPNWNLQVMEAKGWIGLLVLGFGSSLIAFFLQIRSQKVLSPSVASLLFLLESPFSCFFAFWLLGELFSGWQWFGASLILTACAVISVFSEPQKDLLTQV